jgi:uncharacterized protein
MAADSRDLDEVRRVVSDGLRGRRVRVYLFGSWARGEARRISDIDVGILPLEPLPPGLLLDLQEALEMSDVLYPVDLVNLSAASPSLRERVLSEGVLWSA